MQRHFLHNTTKTAPSVALLLMSLLFIGCGGDGASEPTASTPDVSEPIDPPVSDVCQNSSNGVNWDALMTTDCNNLASYGLFKDASNPTDDPQFPGKLYQLSTQLFSNYASKYRFVFVPNQQQISYQADSVFELPIGSVLVKSFALPYDTQITGITNERLIETRLLIHRQGGWTGLGYQWTNGEAILNIAGANINHSMNNQGEHLDFSYPMPSKAECKLCHQSTTDGNSRIIPIGLKAQLLNRDISVDGHAVNQLVAWDDAGLLRGLPSLDTVEKTYPLGDENASLTLRAKGYLDVNCAHCHNPTGFASVSGLRLGFQVDHTSFAYGICKQPPGWDGGEKGLSYDIVPANAEHSILLYRQELLEPKDRMPPLGRTLVHQEGTALIRRWIDSLSPTLGSCN